MYGFWFFAHFLIRDYELFESDTRLILVPKKNLLSKTSYTNFSIAKPGFRTAHLRRCSSCATMNSTKALLESIHTGETT